MYFQGHAVVPSILVGTNQGGIMAYSIDIPNAKQRDTKSPIVMPIGEFHNHTFGVPSISTSHHL